MASPMAAWVSLDLNLASLEGAIPSRQNEAGLWLVDISIAEA